MRWKSCASKSLATENQCIKHNKNKTTQPILHRSFHACYGPVLQPKIHMHGIFVRYCIAAGFVISGLDYWRDILTFLCMCSTWLYFAIYYVSRRSRTRDTVSWLCVCLFFYRIGSAHWIYVLSWIKPNLIVSLMTVVLLYCYFKLLLPEARMGCHGYSSRLVCLFVCDMWVYSPGCHSTAFTAWIDNKLLVF